jgi:hypothetical protein
MDYYGSQYFFQQLHNNKKTMVDTRHSSYMFQPTISYFREVVIKVGKVMATYIRNLQIKAEIQALNESDDKIFVT